MVQLTLGTAQFGMNYGFTNTRGKLNIEEVGEIINYAVENGINNFDTAQAYGDSEKVLGEFLSDLPDAKVMTKLLNNSKNYYTTKDVSFWEENFQKSLDNLRINKIDSFLIHNANDLKKEGKDLLEEWLESLLKRNLINRLGISIYSKSDLRNISLEKYNLIQMPISIYDQRLIKDNTCIDLFKKDIAIHARSILFQGLLLVNSEEWPHKISARFKSHHRQLFGSLGKKSILELTFNFIKNNQFIQSSLIGVTSLEELKEIVQIKDNLKNLKKDFLDLSWDNDSDLDPRLW